LWLCGSIPGGGVGERREERAARQGGMEKVLVLFYLRLSGVVALFH
jgi:hypothetical protein